jgi:hypothetical protein
MRKYRIIVTYVSGAQHGYTASTRDAASALCGWLSLSSELVVVEVEDVVEVVLHGVRYEIGGVISRRAPYDVPLRTDDDLVT